MTGLGLVSRSTGEMVGGLVALVSGVANGILALGIPRPVGGSLFYGIWALVASPLGLIMLFHGFRIRVNTG